MKRKLYTLVFSLSLFTFYSCKTASKLYEKGRYDEAVELAAKKLQKDPNDPKLLDIIRGAYRYAVDDHLSRINANAASNNELKWEWIYDEYASLQRMYNAIYKVPNVFEIVRPVNYEQELVSNGEKAGLVRKDRGMRMMEAGNQQAKNEKQSFRNAYHEFEAAERFLSGDAELASLKQEAYDNAVINVVVLPLQQQGGFVYSSYIVGGTNADDQLLNSLRFNSGSMFVKFYSAWEARSNRVRVDQELDMRLVSADIGRYHDESNRRKVSRDIVVKETVYKPDSVVREYAKVWAEITSTRRSMHSQALLQVTVRDEDGFRAWSDDFTGTHQWSTEFASFTGDSRALSDADKALVNRKKEFAPSDGEVMRCMLDQVLNDATWRIRNFYARYN